MSFPSASLMVIPSWVNKLILNCRFGFLSGPLDPPDGVVSPDSTVGQVPRIKRDARVHAWVIQNAEGECEACVEPAPFITDAGRAF